MPDFKTQKGFVIAELSGVAAALRTLDQAREMYLDSEVRSAYGGASKGIADSVRRVAPVSKYPYASNLMTKRTSSRPGLLRRSIVGKAFNLSAWRRWGPGGFAQVTLRRGAANRAPHANIIKPGRKAIEAGTANGKATGKKKLVFLSQAGSIVFKSKVPAVPPNDFWKRGVSQSQARALAAMRSSLERAWNRRVAK